MDQSLGALFCRENVYGPMALKIRHKLPRDWHWSLDGSSQTKEGLDVMSEFPTDSRL